MPHDIRKLCYDILLAVKEIKEFLVELSYEDYCQNRQVKLAVEREYEIIGEALRRMQTDFEADFLTITDGRKIIDFRNILAHGYDSIADEIVWSITSQDINLLKADIEKIMKKFL